MAINVTVTPGKQFANNEAITTAGLNQLGQPTFAVTGALDNAQLGAGAVTPAKVTPGGYFYATAAYASGVISFDFSPAMPAGYEAGAIVRWKQPSKNTGAVDVNVNSRGNKDLVKAVSGAQYSELAHGDLLPNAIYEAVYDGTRFQLMTAVSKRTLYRATATGTNAYTASVAPNPVSSMEEYDGCQFVLKFDNANSTSVTLQIGTLGSVPIKKNGTNQLVAGDIKAGAFHTLVYDHATTAFYLQSEANSFGNTSSYGFSRDLLAHSYAPLPGGGPTGNYVTGSCSRVVFNFGTDQAVAFDNVTWQVALTSGTTNGTVIAATKKWWYAYAITNGSQIQVMLSENTTPTMPAGYTNYILLGCYNAEAYAFQSFMQRDRKVTIAPVGVVRGALPAAGAVATALDGTQQGIFDTLVAPNSVAFQGQVLAAGVAGAGLAVGISAISWNGTSPNYLTMNNCVVAGRTNTNTQLMLANSSYGNTGALAVTASDRWWLPVLSYVPTKTLWWGSPDSDARVWIAITGYEF